MHLNMHVSIFVLENVLEEEHPFLQCSHVKSSHEDEREDYFMLSDKMCMCFRFGNSGRVTEHSGDQRHMSVHVGYMYQRCGTRR